VLSELEARELGLFQVIFQSVQNPWAESIVEAVTLPGGRPLLVNANELTEAAQNKAMRPLFAAVVRIGVKSERYERSVQIACDLAASLRVFAHPQGNELIPMANDDYPFDEHVKDLLRRQSRRSGMILSCDELIGFVHLPSGAVRTPALLRRMVKSKAAPKQITRTQGVCLGHNLHLGKTLPVCLSPEQRVRHVHIIGTSGTGKSTLLFNLIRQDIENGDGVPVLDPHGDLVERILGIIPAERISDVVLIDPADEGWSVGFNILSAHSDLEKNLLASDLASVFQRLSTSWGDQMASVLKNVILAFLESRRGGTLSDLRRFLLEPKFRDEFLQTVSDPDVLYYWHKGFPQLAGNKSIGPVLTRLETFLSPKPIRYMVSQPVNPLDFADILDTGKIFLAKLSQGLLGQENSYLLGALFAAKLQQLTMARQAQAEAQRKDFWLYVDEFRNYITPSMAEILRGARKYRLGLTLAHQELRQLHRDSEVASAVMSNPGTRICFRVFNDDARKLADGFSFFEARDLQNLETGQAICRVDRSKWDFNLAVPLPDEPSKEEAAERRAAVVTASRKAYATARAELVASALQAIQVDAAPVATEPVARKHKPSEPTQRRPAEPIPAEAVPSPKPPEPQPTPVAILPATTDTDEDEPLHTTIRKRISQEAEGLDYAVTEEWHVPGSEKRVDLVLERGAHAVACEICLANALEYEIGNVRNCLMAGFRQVVVVCANQTKLARLREAVAAEFPPEQSTLVRCESPDKFISQLFEWASEEPTPAIVRTGQPRKQKITLDTGQLTEAERREREREMLSQLAQAMRRKKTA
jgi:hypothetical protein